MSAKRYRKVMAVALVASVGLTAAACTSSDDTSTPGKVTITVDCPPQKTDNGGKSLEQWNKDVATFEAANPNIDDQDGLGRRPVQQPAGLHRPPAGWHPGRRVLRLHDRPAARCSTPIGPRTSRPYINDDTVPNWDAVARRGQEPVHRGRQDLRHRLRGLHHGPGLQQDPVQAGRSRPGQAADHVAGGRRPRPRRSRRRRRAWPATPSTAPATPVAGTSPRAVLPWQLAGFGRRQEGQRQHPGGQGRPAEPQGHALHRQQRGHDPAADRGPTC